MLLLANSDRAVTDRLAGLLSDVETRFSAELVSDLACVNQLAEHVAHYRGKMLRPALLLVMAMALLPEDQDPGEETLVLAAVVEMVHMATLVHDDVLDDAAMRRGGATVNHLRGNEAAVMLGDYLISHAYHLCSSLGRSEFSRLIAAATNTVCEGELLQLSNRDNWAIDEVTYFDMIRRKTASLCGVCCRLPARLGGFSAAAEARVTQLGGREALEEALYQYGERLGMAFQIVDDLLDLTGDPDQVGKTLGRDLEKGKLTLPLILTLAAAKSDERAELQADLTVLAGGERAVADMEAMAVVHARLAARLQAADAVEAARRQAEGLIVQAKAGLCEALPQTPARRVLLEMADAAIRRRA